MFVLHLGVEALLLVVVEVFTHPGKSVWSPGSMEPFL
jgi:hypothetical protein